MKYKISESKNQLIFVPIPKNGTSTVRYLADKYCLPIPRFGRHPTLLDIRKIGRNEKSFTIVRNPYDRVLSIYCHLTQIHKNLNICDKNPWETEETSFRNFCMRNLPLYLKQNSIRKLGLICLPQHYWTNIDDKMEVDIIFKYENCFDGKLQRFLGVSEMPKLNSTKHGIYTEFYTKEIEERVYSIYRRDFELFGYDRDII